MQILIPIFEGVVATSAIGMRDVLMLSGNFYRGQALKPWFNVDLVACNTDLNINTLGVEVHASFTLEQAPHARLIILPAMVGFIPGILEEQKKLVEWLRVQADNGATLVSTCNGAFFIAETGLLDGKTATTSWFSKELFQSRYPKVILEDEKIIVDNGICVTGAATLSFQHLCIYLIEKYYGAELASYTAKFFLIDKGRESQKPYSIFTPQKEHQDKEILKVQAYLEAKTDAEVQISELAELANMSERSFIRRFKLATGNNPISYIQRLKVERAKHLLEDPAIPIKNIGFEVGYEDAASFRSIFKRYTGLNPAEYRQQLGTNR